MRAFKWLQLFALSLGSLSSPTRCVATAIPYDFATIINGWNVVGYSSGPLTCGFSTKPDISEPDYFSLYRQIYPSTSDTVVSQASFWNIDLTTVAPVGSKATATIDLDDKLHFLYPDPVVSSSTVNPQRSVVSFDSEQCLFEAGCAEKPGNMLLHALVSELGDARMLTVLLRFPDRVEKHVIPVTGLRPVLNGVNSCFEKLRKDVSATTQ